jgi:glucan phosphoethanolaminetransferase (alkaline phosphatase superfamily)
MADAASLSSAMLALVIILVVLYILLVIWSLVCCARLSNHRSESSGYAWIWFALGLLLFPPLLVVPIIMFYSSSASSKKKSKFKRNSQYAKSYSRSKKSSSNLLKDFF